MPQLISARPHTCAGPRTLLLAGALALAGLAGAGAAPLPPGRTINVQAFTGESEPPFVYATGNAIGDLEAGLPGAELVVGYGSDLSQPVVSGKLVAYDAAGRPIWSYSSPQRDYVMGVDIGDLEGDGVPEVAVGLRLLEHRGVLLSHAGQPLWQHDLGAQSYVRIARIGELRADYPGAEVLFGGSRGQLALLSAGGQLIWQRTFCSCTLQSAVIRDLDADGANEIVLAVQDGTVKLIEPSGALRWSSLVGGDVMGVAVGQLGGDAQLEIVAASGRRQTAITLLHADGTIGWQTAYGANDWSVAIGNFDGVGLPEIAVGYGSHDTTQPGASDTGGVVLLDPAGRFLGDAALPSSVKMLSMGDADGDGRAEVAASCDDGQLYLLSASSWPGRLFLPIAS